MAATEVYEALTEVLVGRLRVAPELVKPEASLADDLGLDSIDMMTAVMAIEERFGIEVADKEVEDIRTVAEVVDLLSSKVPQGV